MAEQPSNPTQAQQGATQRNNKKMGPEDFARILFKDKGLTERQKNAIELLLRGLSDAEVSAQIGVDRGTIYRWRNSSLFLKELEKQRQQLFQQSVSRLQSMVQPALDILQRQLTGDDAKTALRAAAILLRVATPARLARLVEPKSASPKSLADQEWERMKAYIEAPLPGQPGAPTRAPWEEDEDNELDEEDEGMTNDE